MWYSANWAQKDREQSSFLAASWRHFRQAPYDHESQLSSRCWLGRKPGKKTSKHEGNHATTAALLRQVRELTQGLYTCGHLSSYITRFDRLNFEAHAVVRGNALTAYATVMLPDKAHNFLLTFSHLYGCLRIFDWILYIYKYKYIRTLHQIFKRTYNSSWKNFISVL